MIYRLKLMVLGPLGRGSLTATEASIAFSISAGTFIDASKISLIVEEIVLDAVSKGRFTNAGAHASKKKGE